MKYSQKLRVVLSIFTFLLAIVADAAVPFVVSGDQVVAIVTSKNVLNSIDRQIQKIEFVEFNSVANVALYQLTTTKGKKPSAEHCLYSVAVNGGLDRLAPKWTVFEKPNLISCKTR